MKRLLIMSSLIFGLTLGVEALEVNKEQVKHDIVLENIDEVNVEHAEYAIVLANRHIGSVSTLMKKQSILVDNIYKAQLSITKDVNTIINKVEVKNNIVLFEKVLNGLMVGDADLALLGTENKKLLKQFKIIKKLWIPFKANILSSKLEKTSKQKFTLLKHIDKSVKIHEISTK